MRIRIDIDISAAELAAWLDSMVSAPAPVAPMSPTEDKEDWDIGFERPESMAWLDSKRAAAAEVVGDTDWDFPDFPDFDLDPAPEDTLAAESNAIAAATRWMASRIKGGGHA